MRPDFFVVANEDPVFGEEFFCFGLAEAFVAIRKTSAKKRERCAETPQFFFSCLTLVMLVSGVTSANQGGSVEAAVSAALFMECRRHACHYSRCANALRFVSQSLLMPMRLHAFAALMLGNFRFASFFKRAHSDFQIREC
jgi:hypothetical protein